MIICDTVKRLYNEISNKIFSLFQVEIVIKNGFIMIRTFTVHNKLDLDETIKLHEAIIDAILIPIA